MQKNEDYKAQQNQKYVLIRHTLKKRFMLNTLLKIGQWQSQGKSKWDRFLEYPKIEHQDKHGNERKNYIFSIVFDLDEMDIIVNEANLEIYDEEKFAKLTPIKVQGGNNKAIYTTVQAKKFVQIYKTFFGKENSDAAEGELLEALKKTYGSEYNAEFSNLLNDIFRLKELFIGKFSVIKEKTGEKEISFKAINELIKLPRNESIEVITVKLKKQKLFNSESAKPFVEVMAYSDFLTEKFIGHDAANSDQNKDGNNRKLCYASGENDDTVDSLKLSTRYSLNKMFVEETKNYATKFSDKLYAQNYQVSKKNQEFLDFASDYLLNKGGHKVRIANVDHVIVPQFMASDNIDLEFALSKIKTQSDFLFNLKKLEGYSIDIADEAGSVFWLNFIAFESDGNFFKSTEIIKDVSKLHFQKILRTFIDIDWDFGQSKYIDWGRVMASYGNEGMFFNFNSVYELIPLRKDKEKKNRALTLMKSILENRRLDKTLIFKYYCELLLCHYYERYQSYTNINKYNRDYLSIAIRNNTYKYLAFFEVLRKLNLIDMNEETHVSPMETGNKYDEAIIGFFEKMKLNAPQQAMFYLGRMLNTVEFIQKGKKKTVIEKVNFNGMDRDDIQRLRLSLIEKAKQYSKVGKVIFADSKFADLFNYNKWNMNPQEAVFFLMTGYSFGISNKEATQLEDLESEEVEN